MIKKRPDIERALDRLDPAIRCFLFFGPDESGSRVLAERLAKTLGADAERIDLSPAQLKADPAVLPDEAASVSLFGGARYIRVDGANEDCIAAVEALLEAGAAGNPVVLIAGALKKDAKLVKLVDGTPRGLVYQGYPPGGGDAIRLAIAIGREHGLRLEPDLARRLADATNGDRAILASEIEKLALYADAGPDALRDATHAMIDAIGIDSGEADTSRLLDAVFDGDERSLDREMIRVAAEGQAGIPLIRAVLRRLNAMTLARTEMDRGAGAAAAVDKAARYLFWREKESIAAGLPHWPAARLAAAIDRMAAMERTLKASRGPGPVAADQLLFAMARSARRR